LKKTPNSYSQCHFRAMYGVNWLWS